MNKLDKMKNQFNQKCYSSKKLLILTEIFLLFYTIHVSFHSLWTIPLHKSNSHLLLRIYIDPRFALGCTIHIRMQLEKLETVSAAAGTITKTENPIRGHELQDNDTSGYVNSISM